MKAGAIVAFATLLHLTATQPLRIHPLKRGDIVVTETVWQTVEAPTVLNYVDENGNFISQDIAAAAATPPPTPIEDSQAPAAATVQPLVTAEPASAPELVLPLPDDQLSQPSTEERFPAPAALEAGTPSTQEEFVPSLSIPPVQEAPPSVPEPVANHVAFDSGYNFEERSGYGIGWSNYNGDLSQSSCKPFEQADQEWAQLVDYDVVRLYGVDCGQPGIAFQLAKKYNKKVFVGIYWLDHRLDQQIQDVIDGIAAAGAGWDPVDTISIGNEDVHRGEKTPAEVIAIVFNARVKLRDAGYQGPVVHVDSQDQILANPELCSEAAGDYIAANIHPFFNAHNTADRAGEFVQGQIELLRQCGLSTRRRRDNLRVRATEVGWPKNGDPNGEAIPSKEMQNIAIASIKSKDFDHLILFSAFDHKWMKDGPNTLNTEKFWGILDP